MSSPWLRYLPSAVRQRLEGRTQIQAIVGNISWLSFDRIMRMGVGLVVGVWVARYLGPEQFGLLNFAAAFVSLFSPLVHLGLDSIVTRESVRAPEDTRATLGTAFVLRLLGGILSGLVATATILITRPGEWLVGAMVAIAALAVLFQSLDVIDFWFQSQLRAKYVVYARGGAYLVVAGARVAMILLGAPLIAFAWAMFFELGLTAAGLLVLYRRDGQRVLRWTAAVSRAKVLLRDSWPLFLSGVSVAIYMRIDQVMIGYMVNDAAVGTYSVAIRLVEIWYFLPMAIAASVLPALIKARQEDEAVYLSRLQTFYDLVGALALVIAATISILSTPIISFLYGEKYIAAGPVLAVYAWASVPVFLGVASSQHFLVENLTRISLYRTALGVIVNIALNFVLIPAYGPVGAAIASLFSWLVMAFSIALMPASAGQVGMLLRSLNPMRSLRRLRQNSRHS
jgi:PST family polysaccharide transporter